MLMNGQSELWASISSRPGTARDDQFQLNLDGQQMTQAIALSALFGSFIGTTSLSDSSNPCILGLRF